METLAYVLGYGITILWSVFIVVSIGTLHKKGGLERGALILVIVLMCAQAWGLTYLLTG